MSVTGVFIRHELRTSLRSSRFLALGIVYTIVCALPVIVIYAAAPRMQIFIGPSAFANAVMLVQPMATALFAAAVSIDALTRERDEGSFAVVAVAPLSSTGYVFRRWLAVLLAAAPVTLIPPLLACGLVSLRNHQLASPAIFFAPWFVHVVPVLVLFSAIALGVGTISGQTVIAVIVAAVLFTAGIGFVNDLAARTHRRFDGIGALLMPDEMQFRRLVWVARGWSVPTLPTEAGYALRNELDAVLPAAALPAAFAAIVLGAASRFLRRTRADLRPWQIPPTSRFRTFLAILNRLRTEYVPDGFADRRDLIAVAAGLLTAIVIALLLVRRYDAFSTLAAERNRALTSGPLPMSAAIVPATVRIDAAFDDDGTLHARSALTLRNDGATPVRHLAFVLRPSVRIVSIRAERGSASLIRVWNGAGVEVDPPLLAGESRRLEFVLDGVPGVYRFPFREPFEESYPRFASATETIDLVDLSRAWLERSVSSVSATLDAHDLVPVPRYTPWKEGAERIAPAAAMTVSVRLPSGLQTGDSCGAVSSSQLRSACTTPLATYQLLGGRFTRVALSDSATLLYLDAYRPVIGLQMRSLAQAIRIAHDAWPRLDASGHVLFLQRPTGRFAVDYPRSWLQEIETSGASCFVAERLLGHKEPLDPSAVATAITINRLRAARRIVPAEEHAMVLFYEALAAVDTGSRKANAVIAGGGAQPFAVAIATNSNVDRDRVDGVLAELENRVGHDRLKEGVTDFLSAGPQPGTLAELIGTIARRGNIDLTRFYADYFTGDALPRLTLTNVQFTHNGARWDVRGELRNLGKGESFCPIVLRTDAGSLTQTLRIDSGATVPFSFTTPSVPRTLQLDPSRVCYRYAAIGTVEAVDYRGDGR